MSKISMFALALLVQLTQPVRQPFLAQLTPVNSSVSTASTFIDRIAHVLTATDAP